MKSFLAALSLCFLLSAPLRAELHPLQGPATGRIGDMADIKVPEGYEFFPKDDMKEFMEKTHNLYSGDELGVLYTKDENGFMALFTFEDTGYIKDAANEKLDPDAMWKQMVENEKDANEERKKKGWEEMHLVKWAEEPHYNPDTQRLEWAEVIEEKGQQFVNFNTRILGRKGVMRVIVVPHGEDWQAMLGPLNHTLDGFDYTSGNKYSEWKTGDKVAEFGLAALVVGAAGAVAAKTGLLGKLGGFFALLVAKLGKLLIVALAAVGAFFKKIFGGGKGKDNDQNPPPPPPQV
ncbi:MAG TPA: DUF2167 domain-containing protein [bacterium]|nr:DUF2167 domain-containing protein [bacterium]